MTGEGARGDAGRLDVPGDLQPIAMRLWSRPPHTEIEETRERLRSMIEAPADQREDFIVEHEGRVIGEPAPTCRCRGPASSHAGLGAAIGPSSGAGVADAVAKGTAWHGLAREDA